MNLRHDPGIIELPIRKSKIPKVFDIGTANITTMTLAEFRLIPQRERFDEKITCDSLVILPTPRMHDSGYRCIQVVAVEQTHPLCSVAGGSDVICLDGIGGLGRNTSREITLFSQAISGGWQIDCLPKSGLFRLCVSGRKIRIGMALSSLEIYKTERE
jgi:hypothetical protein